MRIDRADAPFYSIAFGLWEPSRGEIALVQAKKNVHEAGKGGFWALRQRTLR